MNNKTFPKSNDYYKYYSSFPSLLRRYPKYFRKEICCCKPTPPNKVTLKQHIHNARMRILTTKAVFD